MPYDRGVWFCVFCWENHCLSCVATMKGTLGKVGTPWKEVAEQSRQTVQAFIQAANPTLAPSLNITSKVDIKEDYIPG